MIRILIGIVVGVVLAAGAAWEYGRRSGGCFDRCGEGTACVAGHCAVVPPPPVAVAPAPEKRRRRRGGTSATPTAPGDPLAPAAPELTLKPGDEVAQTQGEALGRPESFDFTGGGEAGPDSKLSDDDIERLFAPARGPISSCISRAVGDYPLETAQVEVGFRIERSGRIERVRITAPALLQRQGLARCVRPLVTGLHFPPSGAASVVTYPFQLQ